MRELTQKIRWTQNLKYKQLFAPPRPAPLRSHTPPNGVTLFSGDGFKTSLLVRQTAKLHKVTAAGT